TFNNSEKFKRFIPLIATLLGIVFGVVCFFSLPEIIPADNVFLAIVIGGASGLSATGSHQLLKQLENKKR
ncbi:MAG: phage holin family protein, partial [Bacilli bacterium]